MSRVLLAVLVVGLFALPRPAPAQKPGDKPAKVEHYLKWSTAGCRDGELVFVSGHPGNTDRLNTVAELEYLRDRQYPYVLQRLNRLEVLLTAFGARSDENARRARPLRFVVSLLNHQPGYGLPNPEQSLDDQQTPGWSARDVESSGSMAG